MTEHGGGNTPHAGLNSALGCEPPPPLEMGGDVYLWATHMLARSFPALRETGEITGGPRGFTKADRSNFLNRLETAVQAAKRI